MTSSESVGFRKDPERLASTGAGLSGRVVLAGVGCIDRGDDGVGSVLVRRLAGVHHLRVLDCGDRLEDFTRDIALERPDTVLIVDAVEMGARPGELAVLGAADLVERTGDTHRASLGAVMEYLRWRTDAMVLLLGIQPAVVTDGEGLSPEVANTVRQLESLFRTGWPAPGISAGSTPGRERP